MASWILLLGALVGLVSCSNSHGPECALDSDCAGREDGALRCQESRCVAPPKPCLVVGAPGVHLQTCGDPRSWDPGCLTDDECMYTNNGDAALCRSPGTACVNLVTAHCSLLGDQDFRSRDAVFLGILSSRATPVTDATVAWARDEVMQMIPGHGLPGGVHGRRPVTVLRCHAPDLETAKSVAAHLRSNVHVDALLALDEMAVRAACVPTSEAPMVVGLGVYDDLRAACPDLKAAVFHDRLPTPYQAHAVAVMWPKIDAYARSLQSRSQSPRVAVLASSDAGDVGWVDAVVQKGLEGVSPSGIVRVVYHSPRDAKSIYGSQMDAVNAVLGLRPDVVLTSGGEEIVRTLIPMIEAQLPVPPVYVLTPRAMVGQDVAQLVGVNGSLRKRVLGWAPFAPSYPDKRAADWQNAFREEMTKAKVDIRGSLWPDARTYDAVYRLAYALSVSHGTPVEREDVASKWKRLSSGDPVDVGPDAVANGIVALLSSGSIALRGILSSSTWDSAAGSPQEDAYLYCVSPAGAPQSAGLQVRYADRGLVGTDVRCP